MSPRLLHAGVPKRLSSARLPDVSAVASSRSHSPAASTVDRIVQHRTALRSRLRLRGCLPLIRAASLFPRALAANDCSAARPTLTAATTGMPSHASSMTAITARTTMAAASAMSSSHSSHSGTQRRRAHSNTTTMRLHAIATAAILAAIIICWPAPAITSAAAADSSLTTAAAAAVSAGPGAALPSAEPIAEVDDLDAQFTSQLGPEISEATASPPSCSETERRVGNLCLPRAQCRADTCGGHGLCTDLDGELRCHCSPGFITEGHDGQHCNACDSPHHSFPLCGPHENVDEKRRDTLSPACSAQLLPQSLNGPGMLPALSASEVADAESHDAMSKASDALHPAPAASLWSLRHDHRFHSLAWYWIDAAAGSAEVRFTIRHESMFRMHISKMTQVPASAAGGVGAGGRRSGSSTDDAASAHHVYSKLSAAPGSSDPHLTVVPSLYSRDQFLTAGHSILARNEVVIALMLQPGTYKLLLEYDGRLLADFLDASCPRFLMEVAIEPQRSVLARRTWLATDSESHSTASAARRGNPFLPRSRSSACPATGERLPNVLSPGADALDIPSTGFQYGLHVPLGGRDATEIHEAPGSAFHQSETHTYTEWFTVSAVHPGSPHLSPHGRIIYTLPFIIPDFVGFQAMLSTNIAFDFLLGPLRLGVSAGYPPSFTNAETMWSDVSGAGLNSLHVPLAPGKYFLFVVEPLPQVAPSVSGAGECAFWTFGFRVDLLPQPGIHPGLTSSAQAREIRELGGMGRMDASALCPLEPLPHDLSSIGYAGLHGNSLHVHGVFRIDFESDFTNSHDVHFSTRPNRLDHSSPFAPKHNADEKSTLRLYMPVHETLLRFRVELLHVASTPHGVELRSLKSIDTSVWDHIVEGDLEAGEYILRFSLSPMAFRPNAEYCLGFLMELSVLPLSLSRVGRVCEPHDPVVPDCPAVPYSLDSGGLGGRPFVVEFDRASWEAGSAEVVEIPLEVRYRDTLLTVELTSDFARQPLELALKTKLTGDSQEPLLDVSLTGTKRIAHVEDTAANTHANPFRIDPERRDSYTGHVTLGRQLRRNVQSLRATLKPGHYTIEIRLLAPAPWGALQTGIESSTNMDEAHHICIPYHLDLALETAVEIAQQTHACLEHGHAFVLPRLLNSLEFVPTSENEDKLDDVRAQFSHDFLLPHAHERQDGAERSGDDSGETSDEMFFWVERTALMHAVLDQADQGLRVSLVFHPSCAANPHSGKPPMHHMDGTPFETKVDTTHVPAQSQSMDAEGAAATVLIELDSDLDLDTRAGPMGGVHPDHAAEGDAVHHAAGFSPPHSGPPKSASHPGEPARARPPAHPETDRHGNVKDPAAAAAHSQALRAHLEASAAFEAEEARDAAALAAEFAAHNCDNHTLFESTETLITMHRYLQPGLYSLLIEETDASRAFATAHHRWRSCPAYHLQFSLASAADLDAVSSSTFCNAHTLEARLAEGQDVRADGAPTGTADSGGTIGMDAWPPELPRLVNRPYLFDSRVQNRSLHFQQRRDQLRAETSAFQVLEPFHFFAELHYDFVLSYVTMDLMKVDPKTGSLESFAPRAFRNGARITQSFLPRGEYVFTVGEGRKSMESTPEELRGVSSSYTSHHVSPQDHRGFSCVEFALRLEVLPLSSFGVHKSSVALQPNPSSGRIAGDEHSFKERMMRDAMHPASAGFLASSIAAQMLLHFTASHVPTYPPLPRSLSDPSVIADVSEGDVDVNLFGVFSLNAAFTGAHAAAAAGAEEGDESSTTPPQIMNDIFAASQISFELFTPSVLRLWTAPFVDRLDPEAARSFVIATSLTHEHSSDSAAAAKAAAASAAAAENNVHGPGTAGSAALDAMQTSQAGAPGSIDHFSWMFGLLQPGRYTLHLQPVVLPPYRTTYASSLFGRVQWFESVVQLAISPVTAEAESASAHACEAPEALSQCVVAQQTEVTGAAADHVDHLSAHEFVQSDAQDNLHLAEPSQPVCPHSKGERVGLTTVQLDRRSELTAEVASDFLSNDLLLLVQRSAAPGGASHPDSPVWGRDRWLAHRTEHGQELSLILPAGHYTVEIASLGSLPALPYLFGCGSPFSYALHIEPVPEGAGASTHAHGLVQAKPSRHLIQGKAGAPQEMHPAVQHTTLDPNSPQYACPAYSMFPARLFDPRDQESDLFLQRSRHSARLHGERFQVNDPAAEASNMLRFHYLEIGVEVASILRVDVRTPSKEYTKHIGLYIHHSTESQRRLIEPLYSISNVDPLWTTIVWELKPEAPLSSQHLAEDALHALTSLSTPGGPAHAPKAAPTIHTRTDFLLSLGATASALEWDATSCPYFGLDLIVVPMGQLKEHVVPAGEDAAESGSQGKPHVVSPVGPHARKCSLLHTNAPELTPVFHAYGRQQTLQSHLFRALWWNGHQKSLAVDITLPAEMQHGATVVIVLQHSFVSGLFMLRLERLDEPATTASASGTEAEPTREFKGSAKSMVSSESVGVDTFHPVDLYYTRDYSVRLAALVSAGRYRMHVTERFSGALSKALGVHEDELCVPFALMISIQAYTPLASGGLQRSSSQQGMRAWPQHMSQPSDLEVVALAGEFERVHGATAASHSAVGETRADWSAEESAAFTHDSAAGAASSEQVVATRSVGATAAEPLDAESLAAHHLGGVDSAHTQGQPLREDPIPPEQLVHPLHRADDDPEEAEHEHQSHEHTAEAEGHDALHDPHSSHIIDPLQPPAPVTHAGGEDDPSLVAVAASTGASAGGFSRLMPIRLRERNALDLVVVVLAFLVTLALLCVACSLHCGSLLLACALRVCPCLSRWLTNKKSKYGDDIQLKKTIYYDTRTMDDDNL